MCGIFGILYHNSEIPPDRHRLERTANSLHHRGPDNAGIFSFASVGFVHTRLSLIDLTTRSNQPFFDRTGRYCLVFNGEIYNFRDLRARLETKGVAFNTTSDTEVLLESLLNLGVAATLPELEGMFAFALLDKETKEITVARDRFGMKPLFIYSTDEVFLFASEILSLTPWIKAEPDFPSISAFLLGFSGPTRGSTFLKHVKILEPGTMSIVRPGKKPEHHSFASLADFADEKEAELLRAAPEGHSIELLDELLHQSVRWQLFADAPVGAFCSGGVNSSLIMAIAAKYHNNLAVFHANVIGPFGEYDAALSLAKHLRLDMKSVDVSDADLIDYMPEVIEHYGHPFQATLSSVPLLLVAKLARASSVKALLSGEGADECFLGYNWLAPTSPKRLRHMLRHGIGPIRTVLSNGHDVARSRYWGPSGVAGAQGDRGVELLIALHNRFEVVEEADAMRKRMFERRECRDHLTSIKSLDLLSYNLRALLHRNDSMGMAGSIEARFPFLDTKVVRAAVNMPLKHKVRFAPMTFDREHVFFVDKWIVRKVAERYLPKMISRRPKQAFAGNAYAPTRLMMDREFLRRSFISDVFELSQNKIDLLYDKVTPDLKFKLVQLEVWAGLFLYGASKELLLARLRDSVRMSPCVETRGAIKRR